MPWHDFCRSKWDLFSLTRATPTLLNTFLWHIKNRKYREKTEGALIFTDFQQWTYDTFQANHLARKKIIFSICPRDQNVKKVSESFQSTDNFNPSCYHIFSITGSADANFLKKKILTAVEKLINFYFFMFITQFLITTNYCDIT